MRVLKVLEAGPWVTVQDQGRPGQLAQGVSAGGAADRLALAEGAALVGNASGTAAIELAGMGGTFAFEADATLALTGAEMALTVDGVPVPHATSVRVQAGSIVRVGPARRGVYGMLHVSGGIGTPVMMGARSVHTNAGIGQALKAGDVVPLGVDRGTADGLYLTPADRLGGGTVRVLAGFQTPVFGADVPDRFQDAKFTRDPASNRMGVRLATPEARFAAEGGLNILSEVVTPGDIQMTGDGVPIVLFGDCQTTGGYPRLGTVLACDLPRVVQAATGTELKFRFVGRDEALKAHAAYLKQIAALPKAVRPRIRRPEDMPDLLTCDLISGVVRGDEMDEEPTACRA